MPFNASWNALYNAACFIISWYSGLSLHSYVCVCCKMYSNFLYTSLYRPHILSFNRLLNSLFNLMYTSLCWILNNTANLTLYSVAVACAASITQSIVSYILCSSASSSIINPAALYNLSGLNPSKCLAHPVLLIHKLGFFFLFTT